MSDRIVFLDIDGVLNHVRVWDDRTERASELDHPYAFAYASFDRACVMRLNRILEETGAVCVLSSSWRRSFSLDEMRDMLERNGFVGEIVDKTPVQYGGAKRAQAIREWLGYTDRDVESFVSLDDEGPLPRLVQTDFKAGGLLDEHVERAIEMLEVKID